jgi:hypothetical protein
VRFVFAIIAFVIAAVMIVSGVAQRTFLRAPDSVSLAADVASDAPVMVIDGAALNAFDGSQTVLVEGTGPVFAAYGRTTDVLAWVGDTRHTLVTLDEETGELTSRVVSGTETEIPDPNGSDLWLDDFVKEDELRMTINVPDTISVIIASDGIAPAPGDLTLSWPLDNSTPWAGPLIVGGALVLLLGLGLLLWATHHMRAARGPRRKMPKVPRQPVYKPKRRGRGSTETTTSTEIAEAASSGRRRARVTVPIVLVATLALSGCTADFWPALGDGPVPTPSATEAPGAVELPPPAATVRQVERIVAKISAVVTEADETRDAALLETRFTGPALELRKANYVIRKADGSVDPLAAIPAGPVQLVLPEQTESWPRTVLAIVNDEDDPTIAPVALFLEQADPRSNFKVSYAISLEPSIVFPNVAPASVGAARLSKDAGLFLLSPTEAALAYADILARDVESDSYLLFEAEGDSLRVAVGVEAKAKQRKALPATASLAFGYEIGAAEPIALATNDAGAIVAVTINETTTVKPVEAGAAVNPTGQIKALSGLAISTKGVVATYTEQLMFYIPPAGSDGKIILLGYSQGLVSAKEIK